MAAQQHDGGATDILSLLSVWSSNFTTQTTKAFSELRVYDYIRLVTIIGAYCLLRPYLMKLGAHLQKKQHQADSQSDQIEAGATLSANDLRGRKKQPKIAIPGVDSDSDSEDEDKDDWGRAARLRQRKFVRQMLEAHEQKLREEAEADSDKEIEEFLID
ncbi:PGA2-homolog C27.01c [Lasiodiplodia hormozganensis]|uniref:PGA2-homolog C27.01c n=1 Tax=Lasiodiplodia hormozganensis TaxID=869390 RepID=A0AA39Z401_9PEZI|nr:PGA2-homolog C27.01c [Lasiodiplodia hormozganensis]